MKLFLNLSEVAPSSDSDADNSVAIRKSLILFPTCPTGIKITIPEASLKGQDWFL
jgi:hypothetical protein